MKTRASNVEPISVTGRVRSIHILMGLLFVYCLLMTTEFPAFLRVLDKNRIPKRFLTATMKLSETTPPRIVSSFVFLPRRNDNSSIFKNSMNAWIKGEKLWAQVNNKRNVFSSSEQNETFRCPESVSVVNGVRMPCGMRIGSHVTIVGQPKRAHDKCGPAFVVDLSREKGVRGEDSVTLLHFNATVREGSSGKTVIEMNHRYRQQWGNVVRCHGWKSMPSDETVDGQVKCESWKRDDDVLSPFEGSKAHMWFRRLMGKRKKAETMESPYPFLEGELFVMTITTGLEGYHISVNGRHIASFAYRTGFDLEDEITINISGDINVHSTIAGSLPTSNRSITPSRHLEKSAKWKAQPLPNKPITLFIGVISAADHFAERMAVRKSWMQHHLIKSSSVVACFFVALHEEESVNLELKKEAEFFGDIVVVPYLDNYDLVVLKTLAIFEFGVKMLSTKYIMKCDDDTFVRVDAVVEEAMQVSRDKSIYLGKINYYHEPLRKKGKWAVTYQEWPGDVYPPYADGPGYILSSDIARFIVSEFQKNRLKLFKMEDVSVGMWVEQFNKSRPIKYSQNEHFRQSGCVNGYITAHYQSPKQLVCLWEKLQTEEKPKCCNM